MLQSVSVGGTLSHGVTLTNDALGQALRRDEDDYNTTTGNPHEVWYRFDGKQIGYLGNNGTDNIDYTASLARRTTASAGGQFKNGQTYGAGVVDFDQAYEAVNSYQQGSGGGSYTVRAGDSLAGIAAQLWGDSGLWYKLAEANGLGADSALSAGQSLRVPSGVMRSSNSASTFRPYDVSEAYGDTSPTTPAPQKAKGNKCGAFGIILLVVIAVAVTVVSAGAAVAALTPTLSLGGGISAVLGTAAAGTVAAGVGATTLAVAGTIGAVVGSAVSQLVGMATGIQQGGFSWKAVALAGLTAAVSGGIGAIGQGGKAAGEIAHDAVHVAASVTENVTTSAMTHVVEAAGKFAVGALRSAAINAATQGIAVATHLQDKFDWGGVASAAVGGGLASSVHLPGGRVVNSVAGRIAGVGASSLVTGTDFGDNLMQQLPDIVGQTIGDLVTSAIGRAAKPRDIAAERRAAPSDGPEPINPKAPSFDDWGDPGTIPVTLMNAQDMLAAIPDFGSQATDGHLIDGPIRDNNNFVLSASNDNGSLTDAIYYPSTSGGQFQLTSSEEARDPRLRMGGNGGPPLEDWRILRQLGQPVPDGPAGALFGFADNLFELTGPATDAQAELLDNWTRKYKSEILAIDPNHLFPSVLRPSGDEAQSLRWKLADNDFYRSELAATKYIVQHDIGALQIETLRVYQGFIDEGFGQALSEAKEGSLYQPPGWTKAQALGVRTDQYARGRIEDWFVEHGINPGQDINVGVNNRMKGGTDDSYTIPDVRVGGMVLDGTLARKSIETPQVRNYYASPMVKSVFIVRPTQFRMGGTYVLRNGSR